MDDGVRAKVERILNPLALWGIAQRSIHTHRSPDCGRKQQRKAFPKEVQPPRDVLRKRQSEHGLNQRELAAILQVSRDRIQAWERNEAMPSAEEWKKLADVLGLPTVPSEINPNSGL